MKTSEEKVAWGFLAFLLNDDDLLAMFFLADVLSIQEEV